ncbi:MAG: penicillin acylase family protein [Pseudomonadota bacterium]
MGLVLRWLRRIFLAVGGVAIAATALSYYLASRSLPDYAADRIVDGPTAQIEIIRDERAVPHIFAKTEYDAYFGLGYVHAQDRLWQMELRRRMAQGRITELAGAYADWGGLREFTLRIDETIRALDIWGHSQRGVQYLSQDAQRALQAYSDGVNAWLSVVDEEALGRGAPELLLAGATVDPWTPADSIASFKMLAASLSAATFQEIRRAKLLIAVGPKRVEDLLPEVPGGAVVALPPYAELFQDAEFRVAAGGATLDFDLDLADRMGASNAWAVDARRSATRAPLLATDPHLPLQAPSVWHLARIEFPNGGVIGGTVPGIPSVLIGRNESFGWGLTTVYADTQDLFIEKLNPDNPNEYLTPDGWRAFETREEWIPLGQGEAVQVTLRRSRHGPVLPLDWAPIAAVTPTGHVAAIQATLLTDEDRSLEASMRLMRSRSVDEALKLAELVVAPNQNVVGADAGKIALATVGRTPLRKPGSKTQGRIPSPGWEAENDWAGFMRAQDLPRAVAPASGGVANANNKITSAAFPRHLGFDWPEPYRVERLEKLLNNREFHTRSGFEAIQNDTVSEMARAVLPLLAGDLWPRRDAEVGQRRDVLDLLASWNGEMDALRPEPLIFTAWARAATRRLTVDELGADADQYTGVRPLFLERVFRNLDGAADRWCDDIRTPTPESCSDIASIALDDALEELRSRYGGAISSWRWGKAHLAMHRHQPLGWSPFSSLFNIIHESGGSDHTIFRGKYSGSGDTPYANVHAGGLRAIYDFADLDRSVVAMSTGQSGHFLSRHYDDLSTTWRSGDYFPLSLAREDAEAGAVGVTILRPAD